MINLLILIVQFGGLGLYFYTIYLAYQLSGLLAAIVSSAFPGLANVYWIYDRWDVTGIFLNFYTQVNIAYICALIFTGLTIALFKRES